MKDKPRIRGELKIDNASWRPRNPWAIVFLIELWTFEILPFSDEVSLTSTSIRSSADFDLSSVSGRNMTKIVPTMRNPVTTNIGTHELIFMSCQDAGMATNVDKTDDAEM